MESYIKITNNIVLADKSYNKPQRIDMLIGAELFFDLLGQDQIKLTNNGPTLKETKFGWIMAGPILKSPNANKEINISLMTH